MIEYLRQIAIFAKTVEHGSFRGAARALRLSPSVVSHHISTLEEHLEVALIYRSTRKLALTPEGEKLFEAAQKMLNAAHQGLTDISTATNQPVGDLRIALPSVLAQSDLTRALGRFSKRHPGVNLLLNYSDTRQELIKDGFDIAIRMGVNRKRTGHSKHLFHTRRCLVASRAYLTERETPKSPEDLVNWDWMELSPVFHIKPSFAKQGEKSITLKTTPRIQANDARALFHLVKTGNGIAIIPEILAKDDIKAGNVISLFPDWTLNEIDVHAEWPVNAPRNGLIRQFVDELSRDLTE